MKKFFYFLFSVFLFISCQSGKKANIIYFAHTGEITSLDPVYSYDAITHGTLLNIYDTLIGFDGSNLDRFVPLISEKIPSKENGLISDDGKTYIFPIRKGIKFHDGQILTPLDVKYSLLRFMIMDIPAGPSSLLLEPIFGITSIKDEKGNLRISEDEFNSAIEVDNDRVIIRLKKPFAPFLSVIARWSYVLSSSCARKLGEWDGNYSTIKEFSQRPKEKSGLIDIECGSGPYSVVSWDKAKKQIILRRFDDYWRGKASVEMVVQKTVSEFSTRKLMIERGDADIIEVPRIYESQLKNIPRIKLYSELPRLSTDPVFFFTFDVNPLGNQDIGSGKLDGNGIPTDFFKDKDVRKAFAYAFNYDEFLRVINMKGVRAYSPVPPSVMKLKSNIYYEHDIKKAEYHFKKAFGGKLWEKGFRFTLTYNTGSDVRQIACEIMKKYVESINSKFKIDIRGVDWAIYLEKAQSRKMPMFTRGWVADYPDPHNFIFAFYHSNGRYPKTQGFSNPQLDRLIENAASYMDYDRRRKMYEKIIDIANDNVYQIYTIHPYGLIALRDDITDFIDNPINMGIYYYWLKKGGENGEVKSK